MEFSIRQCPAWRYTIRRWLRPAGRRLSKRTVTTQCPGIGPSVSSALPPRIGRAVRCAAPTSAHDCECHEGRGAEQPPQHRPRGRRAVHHALVMYLPCRLLYLCHAFAMFRIAWWKPIQHVENTFPKCSPCHVVLCDMVIRYAFAPKSLPCNHLRICFALVLPRSYPSWRSHGTRVAPGPANGST